MGTHSKSSKTARTKLNSIKYTSVPLKISSFDISDIGLDQNVNESKSNSHDSEPKSTREILSTAEFVSAVGGLWNCANQGLSVLQPRGIGRYSDSSSVNAKENIVLYSDGGERNNTSMTGRGNVYVDSTVRAAGCSSNSKFEFVSVVQKISMYESCCGNDRDSLFRRCIQRDSSEMNKLASVTIPFDLGSVYRWMNGGANVDLKNMDTLSPVEFKKSGGAVSFEGKSTLLDNLTMKSVVSDSSLTECQDMLPHESIGLAENVGVPVSSLCSEHFLRPVVGLEATSVVSRASDSTLRSDFCVDDLVPKDSKNEECERVPDNESCKKHITELHIEKDTPELCSGMKSQLKDTLVKQRHAFAGALAGTFVSLCLHPVDTIKTVIQAHNTVQKPIFGIVGSIISDRGVSGLYRGIASNVASSAPISAVYTFTYESVKAYLLPRLPQEYRSVAHCTAGGCASIATSFIFTPSERIKQQMQVSSQYRNSWTALVSILKHGGFPSLYAGWGAVLCRNIPHSVIKFYTYESLKQLFLSSTQSTHPNTFQTLICGGLAGSTAALFTTPFDVVKTRLQTEIPGSLRKYDGVFHALREIAKDEGLKGLYRGLTPRLIMYVTQGALFFASYECLKAAFCLEVPKLLSPTIQNNRSPENESTTSPVLLSKQQTIQVS